MIDSHCHLADTRFQGDLPDVLERAKGAGLTALVTIGDSLEESELCRGIAESYADIYATAGVHPHNAKNWKAGDDVRLKAILRSSEKMKAVGEIGLDYHYDNSPRDVQCEVFKTQLSIAKEMSLPVVVHCREAVEDVWTIVSEIKPEKLVVHCCTEKFSDVERFLKAGYFLSFTGIATYPDAHEIRQTILQTPIEQMMIETDAPYLSPVPHRGKRNEPAFVTEVAVLIAKSKGLELTEIDRITTKNTVEFFGLPS